MFNVRLIRFFLNYDKQTRGFVPEMYRLLSKYGLTFVLSMYVRSGGFPSVVRWKTFLNQGVFESTKLTLYNRLCDRYSLDLVRREEYVMTKTSLRFGSSLVAHRLLLKHVKQLCVCSWN